MPNKPHTPFYPLQVVKEYFPSLQDNDEKANEVLWACTGWPHFFHTDENNNTEDCLRKQLSEISARANKCPETAMAIADHDLDEAMKKYKIENPEIKIG